MDTLIIMFHECEHWEDLDNYMVDVKVSGGKVISRELNTSEETGEILVQCEDKTAFLAAFKETNACQFTQYSDI